MAKNEPTDELDTMENHGQIAESQQRHDVSVMNRFSDAELRSVQTMDDALALAQQYYETVDDITQDLGNGFTLIGDKNSLIGKRMVLLQWTFNLGDFGEFASVVAVTDDNQRVIFNDGSTGIYDQLRALTGDTHRYGGYYVPNGLRANTYTTCPECNRAMPQNVTECKHCGFMGEKRSTATTFYIDTSA